MADLTLLLDALHRGEPNAAGALLAQVYAELRTLARAKMAREQPGHTLQPTALVHEAWLKLGDQRFENRAHFFSAAAEAMRRILVEPARSKQRDKRGAGAEHGDVDELLRVHEVLDRFAAEDPQKADMVKLRFFVGPSLAEAGAVLGLPERTAKRHWAYARAWLFAAIEEDEKPRPK